MKAAPGCPVSGSQMNWRTQGCVWGVLATLRHREIGCQWLRSPGVPDLKEPFGIEGFHRKGMNRGGSLQKRPWAKGCRVKGKN